MRSPAKLSCSRVQATLRSLGWLSLAAASALSPLGARAQPLNKPDLSPTAAAHTIEAPTLTVASTPTAHAEKPKENSASPLPAIEDPELPGLVRKADGSYRFQGTNFSAAITKEGQVSFRDSYFGFSRRMTPLPPPARDHDPTPSGAQYQRTTPWLALQFRIDLHGYIESRLGNDPYLSERRWFMERTKALRESLGERALTHTLRATLLKIWSDAGLSLASRKQETFELWNQTNADESGRLARLAVQEFVRERCPIRSSCAFRSGELSRFNEHRLHKEVFSPYAHAEESKRALGRTSEESKTVRPARKPSSAQ